MTPPIPKYTHTENNLIVNNNQDVYNIKAGIVYENINNY